MKPLHQVYLTLAIVVGIALLFMGLGLGVNWLDKQARENRAYEQSLKHHN